MTSHAVSVAVGYQCINTRGAIAHGRRTELHYDNNNVASKPIIATVEQLFYSYGGAKVLYSVEDIKDELIKNGPVVSTSFCPSTAFVSDNSIQQRDILIVGWKQLPSGEAWIVQPLCKEGSRVSKVACVAIGQYGIDDRCVAPMNSFDNKPWQSGPYYDTSMRGAENVWRSWKGLKVTTTSVDALFRKIGTTKLGSLSLPVVTVRNELKIAHSRKARVSSITWDAKVNSFNVEFNFI